ncbi:MAG: FAD binding domain-containing protein, partial [Candidatus Tumulicola sp.]
IQTDTLIDLETLGWPALTSTGDGLDIAATCKIAELYAFAPPKQWIAGGLIAECCRSFLSSFKIWNEATIGGNIVMSLPAGPMISLTVALEATYELWPREGSARRIPAAEFVTGVHANVLAPGELLRAIHVSASVLERRHAFRRASQTHLGRSSVLLIGTRAHDEVVVTVTAATVHPVQLRFDRMLLAHDLRGVIDATIPPELYLDDVHGSPAHRRYLTNHFAHEICEELFAS